MQLRPILGAHRRWLLLWLLLATLGLLVAGWRILRPEAGGLTVTILQATPTRGEWDLVLELRNDSGRELLLTGMQMPWAPELILSESERPLDAEGRRRLEVWVNSSQSHSALEAPTERPIEVTRCQPKDLELKWNTPIRLPASEALRSIRASLHVLSQDSFVGIAYVPLQKPGPAIVWIRYQLFRWKRLSPDWLGGTRARYLELRPPLLSGGVFDSQARAPK